MWYDIIAVAGVKDREVGSSYEEKLPGTSSGDQDSIILVLRGKGGVDQVVCVWSFNRYILINFLHDFVFGPVLAATTNEMSDIVGKFNSLIAGRLFINLDEARSIDGADSYHAVFDKMKNIITEPTTCLELKGVNVIKMQSYCNFIITTNNERPVKLEKYDMRYALFTCGEMHFQDRPYFDEFAKVIMNQEAGNHFLTYLLGYAKGNIDIIPETELRKELMQACRPKAENFFEALKCKEVSVMYDIKDKHFITITSLYHAYKNWCKDNGQKELPNDQYFGKMATKNLGESVRCSINKKQVRGYILPHDQCDESDSSIDWLSKLIVMYWSSLL